MLSSGVIAGSIFDGRYSDPNHPEGFREIKIDGDVDPNTGFQSGTCVGSDTSSTEPDWTLTAKAGQTETFDEIVIDFSPKGGPADFIGRFESEGGEGIRWLADNNKWPKVSDIFLQ